MLTLGKRGIRKPSFLFNSHLADLIEPSTVKEALQNPKWTQAMIDEFNALMKNNTWI